MREIYSYARYARYARWAWASNSYSRIQQQKQRNSTSFPTYSYTCVPVQCGTNRAGHAYILQFCIHFSLGLHTENANQSSIQCCGSGKRQSTERTQSTEHRAHGLHGRMLARLIHQSTMRMANLRAEPQTRPHPYKKEERIPSFFWKP